MYIISLAHQLYTIFIVLQTEVRKRTAGKRLILKAEMKCDMFAETLLLVLAWSLFVC